MLIDSSSPANPKQDKFIENHSQTHQIQTFENQRQRKKVKASRGRKNYILQTEKTI